MKSHKIQLIAFGISAAALASWFVAGTFVSEVLTRENERNARAIYAEGQGARETALLRLHTLARDTKDARQQLDSLTKTEVLKVADIIESVGQITDVKLKINGAEPEALRLGPNGKMPPLRAVNFLVETDGTFSALMHTINLLENLPAISSIQNLELERKEDPSGSSKRNEPLWRLSTQIKVMTSAEI